MPPSPPSHSGGCPAAPHQQEQGQRAGHGRAALRLHEAAGCPGPACGVAAVSR